MKKLIFLFVIVVIVYGKGHGQSDTTIQILPENPTINDDIKLVTYKCSFNTTSYKIVNDTIIFKINTNSQFWSFSTCLVAYDTVDIGKLNQGTWTLDFYYIDKAHTTIDSIIYSETISFQVSGSTMTPIKTKNSNWKIYPNPANEVIIIENSDSNISNNDIYLTIIDFQGKVLQRKYLSDLYSKVDISDLENGSYLIRVSSDNKIFYRQILIKK